VTPGTVDEVSGVLAFLAVSVLVIVTPGQDTALTIRNTLAGGRRCGVFTGLGVAAGQACWTVAASVGVTALLIASEPAFMALKYAGAAYLVFLGLQALNAAWRSGGGIHVAARGTPLAPRRALRQGMISNLGNPKMAVFFSSLLPQFAPSDGGTFLPMLALGLVFCILTFLWLALYAAALTRARDVLSRPRVRRALDATMGTALVALGVRLAAVER
jgi:threonine/homoserine/homoserine lactone efflux protein